jgi:glucose-6-phosphate 1-dehydrogenase
VQLQSVDMNFDYGDAFNASRYTGYEVMIYACSRGDATLFSRGDLVEAAWRIAQPLLDYWSATPAVDFPNYARSSWGPTSAYELLEKDGRRWFEVVTPDVLEQSPMFKGADRLLMSAVILAMHSVSKDAGDLIVRQGDVTEEMYFICRGEVEVLDNNDEVVSELKDGNFFGEIGLLMATGRIATVRAKTPCDLFVLGKADFSRILRDHPQFGDSIMRIAKERYDLTLSLGDLLD